MIIHDIQYSSHLLSIGHEEPYDGIIVVAFTNGDVYKYTNVPFAVVQACIEADSVGKYFNNYIRSTYEYEKVA